MAGDAGGSGAGDRAPAAGLPGRGRARLRADRAALTAHPLDLELDGLPGAVTSHLLETGDGPALVDPGPSTTLDALEGGLRAVGASLDDVRHLLLTHVHLDHAGGAGHLAARLPRATVHVHEDGAPHLVTPERLVASTRRTFGDAHDRLWGEVRPIPAHRIRAWRPGARSEPDGIRGLPTPGHIDHHVAWIDEREGTLFAGDALGIVLHPDAATHPATPPPAVDLDAWSDTLDLLASVAAERVAVAHVGLHDDVVGRIRSMREALETLVERVRTALDEGRTEEDAEAWEEEVRARLAVHRPREEVDRYFDVFRAATDHAGVVRAIRRGRVPQRPQGSRGPQGPQGP